MLNCKRCDVEYSIENISKRYINKDPSKYEYCSDCRKIKKCPICEIEFKHHQNQTCSNICAKKMKELTNLKSGGATHNFCRTSNHRKSWEDRLLNEEGIINVFQREEVKNKIKKTNIETIGVDNPSKSEIIKDKKKKTLSNTLSENPNLYKKNWLIIHKKLMKEFGYDPRLHVVGRASKESLLVFNRLFDWCLSIGIEESDIFFGVDGKNEYFIKSGKSIFFYDFTIKSHNIIIEFHGTAFHVNLDDPLYEEWRNPFTGENWKENIRKRKIKNNKAKRKRFNMLEIWSNVDPDTNLEFCKKFIIENK